MNEPMSFELLSSRETVEDKNFTFNPTCFKEYLGQSEIKEKLRVYVEASKITPASVLERRGDLVASTRCLSWTIWSKDGAPAFRGFLG